MKMYLAGCYGRRKELLDVAERLEAMGHKVTARWLNGPHVAEDGSERGTAEEQRAWALEDLADVREAEVVVCFTEEPAEQAPWSGRGGRHYEAGYAAALGKDMIVVGPAENIFYNLGGLITPCVEICPLAKRHLAEAEPGGMPWRDLGIEYSQHFNFKDTADFLGWICCDFIAEGGTV